MTCINTRYDRIIRYPKEESDDSDRDRQLGIFCERLRGSGIPLQSLFFVALLEQSASDSQLEDGVFLIRKDLLLYL
jgi:hypothetical protein